MAVEALASARSMKKYKDRHSEESLESQRSRSGVRRSSELAHIQNMKDRRSSSNILTAKEKQLKDKVSQVTALLDSFLDDTELNKIRAQRLKEEQMNAAKYKKLDSAANAQFTKAIHDNFHTIWRDPERVKAEIAQNALEAESEPAKAIEGGPINK